MAVAELHENTLAELLDRLGGIPAHRVLLKPPPGTASEEDVIAALEQPRKRICELIDGTLVEKAVGTREGLLAFFISRRMGDFVEKHDLGLVLPGDAPLKFRKGLVLIPDVCFIPWERIPNEVFPTDPIAQLTPELAVEVLSPSNTKREIERKLIFYFAGDCKLAWIIDPKTKTAKVHTSAKRFKDLDETGVLDGGKVLPGFTLSLAELFASTRRRKKKPQ